MRPAWPASVGRDGPRRGTVARRAGLDSAVHWHGRRSRRAIGPGALQPQGAVVLGEAISENLLIVDDGLQILGASAKVSGGSLGIIDEVLQGAGALIRLVELGVQIGDLLLRRFLEKESVLQHVDQARLNGFRGLVQGVRAHKREVQDARRMWGEVLRRDRSTAGSSRNVI